MTRAVDLVVDSGAFSAWRQHLVIPLQSYIRFLLRHHKHLEGYINLDVIPDGNPEAAAKQGWDNYETMLQAGLFPMPVYHMGERRYWLEKMLDSGAKTIGLGGIAPLPDSVRRPWLDEVFGYLCGNQGYPSVKVHGFGITSPTLIHRYPWASTDSVTWMIAPGNGVIYVPKPKVGGGYDYSRPPFVLALTKRVDGKELGASSLKHMGHLETCGIKVRQYVLRYIEEQGLDLEAMRRHHMERFKATIRFLRAVAHTSPQAPFHHSHKGLFAKSSCYGSSNKPSSFRLIFSMADNEEFADLLQDEGVRDRLVTYYLFLKKAPFSVPQFVSTGRYAKSRVRLRGVVV